MTDNILDLISNMKEIKKPAKKSGSQPQPQPEKSQSEKSQSQKPTIIHGENQKLFSSREIETLYIEERGIFASRPRVGRKVHKRGWNACYVYELQAYIPYRRQWLCKLLQECQMGAHTHPENKY